MDTWLPLSGGKHWTCIKNDAGNITCSKFNIPEYYSIDPTYINRITANVIDLPSSYPKDFLVINAHFKASGGSTNDAIRQDQADAIIKFIREIKTSGSGITFPYGTPFVISGDLNLVGLSQQQTTLLTGDIQDNATFGNDIKPDWDNTDLSDIISFHTDKRVATTHQEEGSPYWPGRLDYTIASDIGATVSKTFTVSTNEMSAERLSQYNLQQNDTKIASDHLPKVTDFSIDGYTNISSVIENTDFILYPNPAKNKYFSVISNNRKIIKDIQISNITGKIIFSEKTDSSKISINLSGFPSGIYFVRIKTENSHKILKLIL
ncbi:MAG: T9SS type A sorting domain-containing protein [Bacteroidales bacterium]|nr:T9SS type A sorting domain-containing protein [Bacteroidales bacterium]